MSRHKPLLTFAAVAAFIGLLSPVTVDAGEPGAPVKLDGSLQGGSIFGFSIVGGGDYVVYSFRDSDNDWHAYSVPIGGGEVFKLNPPGSEIQMMPETSIDSDVVVFVTGTGFTDEETWAANVRTEKRSFVANGPGNEVVIGDVTVSPNGKWVALLNVESTPDELTLYPTSGGPGVEMGPGSPGEMQFSPNSKYLVYSAQLNGDVRMFSYHISDGERRALGPWGDFLSEPATSVAPDSSSVVFYQDYKLRSASMSGDDKTVLWSGKTGSTITDVQINGTSDRVVYETEGGNGALRSAVIGTATSSIVLIPSGLEPLPATLSPDGEWAVMETETGLRSVMVEGGDSIQLDGTFQDISPDSGTVLITYTGAGEEEVGTMPISGGEATQLVTDWAPGATLGQAEFYGPGGDALYQAELGNGADLFRVTLSGGEAQRINVPGEDKGVYRFALSPDGKYVVYMGGNGTTETHHLYSAKVGYHCDGRLANVVGTQGVDDIIGTNKSDVVVSFQGADEIDTKKGDDTICAGAGDDLIRSGPGADRVLGQGGSDSVFGEAGADSAVGGDGSDVLRGQRGEDDLFGGAGADDLRGGDGEDVCKGGPGTDVADSCETTDGVP